MKSQRQRISVIPVFGRSLLQCSALSTERRTWLRGRLMAAMIAALLLTSLPFVSLAHAARLQRPQDAFKVLLTTSHFGLQFLHAAADNLKDPNGATFSVTNGATLWYGMDVKATAGVSHPTAADPVGDPVTDFLGAVGLLPPSDIIPINLDGSLFETIKLREAFTAPGQQVTITLTPFSSKALILDALSILLSLVGMQSSTAFGLLQGALGQVLQLVTRIGALIKFIGDLNHLLAAVPNVGAALLAANACVDDLIQLFSNQDEVKLLGQVFVLMLGSVASDEVVSAIAGFASAIIGVIEAVRLGKYLLDFGLSLGSFLFQGDVAPTVTLQSIPANASVQQTLFLTSAKGMLYAVNSASGQEEWHFDAAGGFAPEVLGQYGATLLVLRVDQGINNPPFPGTLYGLNVDTGRPEWFVPEVAIYAYNTSVVIVLGNNGLESIDPQSGKPIWQVSLPGAPWNGLASGNVVYIMNTVDPSQPLTLSAFSITSGAHLWDASLSSPQGSHANSGGIFTDPANPQIVYATSNDQSVGPELYYLDAFDVSSGSRLWTYTSPSLQTLGASDHRVLLSNSVNPQLTIALDAQSGKQIWDFPSAGDAASIACAVGFDSFIQGSQVYIPCSGTSTAPGQGILFALNLTDGSVLWRQSATVFTGTEESSSVQAVTNNEVYYAACSYPPAGGETCRMVALNSNDGSTLWSYNGAYANVTNSSIIVYNNDGSVIALDINSGHPVWPTSFTGDGSGITNAVVGI